MKLIRFHKDQDWGQDYYLQVLFTKRWALFQGSVSWCEYPGWPFLQIKFGMGSLICILFQAYKFGFTIGLFERTRNNDLKRNYGITLQEHQKMFDDQNGLCAICGKSGDGRWKKLCVDHDHTTGGVRQLLCRNCNMVLGQVGDSTQTLQSMIEYLNKHKFTKLKQTK